jgi:hypothetical protein
MAEGKAIFPAAIARMTRQMTREMRGRWQGAEDGLRMRTVLAYRRGDFVWC